MTNFTAEEKRRAVERELALRKRVYPNRINTGRMSLAEADHQIKIMEAIRDDYTQAAAKDRLL